jgi:hypothetical protein
MNKLWVFGDSYSEPFDKIDGMPWKVDYINWKGYTPKSYGEIISDKLKLTHINLANGGADNYSILDSIIPFLDVIDSNDIIIIGWSQTLRFRVVNKKNKFNTIRPGTLDKVFELNKNASYLELSDSTLTEIAVNRNNSVYIDELNNYIKLLNFSFSNNKIIHWSPFREDKNGLLTTFKSLDKLELVSAETNGVVDDAHFSENAHYKLSDKFIDIIDSYQSVEFKKSLI